MKKQFFICHSRAGGNPGVGDESLDPCFRRDDIQKCQFLKNNFLWIFAGMFALPKVSEAVNLVVCSGSDCNFQKFILLINNFVKFLFELSIPVVAGIMVYAGFLFLTAGGDKSKLGKAKGIFGAVIWGFILMLVAWLVVSLLTSLLSDKYTYLK